MVEDDRASGDAGRQPEAAAEDQRAGDLEVAEIAGTGGDGEAQEQRRVRGHRLQQWHLDSDRGEQQREVEGVDDERERRQAGEANGQLRRPQTAGPGPERKGLARERRGEARRQQPAGRSRADDTRSDQRGAEHRRQQSDGQRRGTRETPRRVDGAAQGHDLEACQHQRDGGQVARLVDDDRRQRRAGGDAVAPP